MVETPNIITTLAENENDVMQWSHVRAVSRQLTFFSFTEFNILVGSFSLGYTVRINQI